MVFSRQEYWSGFLFPSPGYLSDPGMEMESPTLQVDSLPTEPSGKPTVALSNFKIFPNRVDTRDIVSLSLISN